MKKIFAMSATIIMMACFAACGSPKTYDASDAPVIGEWEVTEVSNLDYNYDIDMALATDDQKESYYSILTFNDDGTYTYTKGDSTTKGIFEMSDDNTSCTLNDDNSDDGILAVLICDGDTIQWIDDTFTYTYSRK